ncbi:scoloptoxin SSD558-like [Tribolium madens]|uniref:scoloptoxin SSD558-like n=1 Tax=Tribolium madens TaxID=41895 RepID=UPI001CF72514|nr:scoloptoxin SSD558-like [Tribolium madens]
MFQKILFFALLFGLCINDEGKFDPTKMDYCDRKCQDKKSVGCDCKTRGTRKELQLEKISDFRQLIVDKHNYWRNYLASGNETRNFAKSVSDMLVMNYDLELEFLARCYGRSTYDGDHSYCIKLERSQKAAQNTYGLHGSTNDPLKLTQKGIEAWFGEVANMEENMYGSFRVSAKPTANFMTMVWGDASRVGCAVIYSSDTKKDKYKYKDMVTSLICNYAKSKGFKKDVLTWAAPIHTQGPPCTKCPDIPKYNKCNSKYTSLCGELEPVPTEKPWNMDKKKNKSSISKNNLFGVLVLVVLLLVFL